MKLLILKYDNGYAVTATFNVPDPKKEGQEQQVQQRRVFENREAMLAYVQEKL